MHMRSDTQASFALELVRNIGPIILTGLVQHVRQRAKRSS